MIKLTSLFLIAVICLTGTLRAQTVSEIPVKSAPQEIKTDLKEVFKKETGKKKDDFSSVNVKQLEKIDRQIPQKKWSKKEKTFLVLGIIGAAALLFLLIKYGKNCLEYENDCNPSEEGCYCRVYEENND